jgi:hypothetical protein
MTTKHLLLLSLLGACGGSASSAAPSPVSSAPISRPTGAGNMRVTASDPSTVHILPYQPDQVWRALPGVFDSLGIEVADLDPAKRMIGNTRFKVRGRLKNVPLSRYIDCGTSTQVGPNADSYDVSISLLAEVRPAESSGSTRLTAIFDALAKPGNFAQDYSQCSSKGALETRFIDILNARLKR